MDKENAVVHTAWFRASWAPHLSLSLSLKSILILAPGSKPPTLSLYIPGNKANSILIYFRSFYYMGNLFCAAIWQYISEIEGWGGSMHAFLTHKTQSSCATSNKSPSILINLLVGPQALNSAF